METGDHSNCPIELVACPEHLEQRDLEAEVDEFLLTPAGIRMAELFARRDALADDDPERDVVVAEIMKHSSECMNRSRGAEDDEKD